MEKKMMKVTKYSTQIEKDTKRPYLVSEKEVEVEGPVSGGERIAMAMETVFHASSQSEEYLWMIAMNVRDLPCGIFEVSHGNINSSLAGPREIYQKALLAGAASIAICHNHPSGDPNPSSADLRTTKMLKEAGNLLGVPLVDHVIIGDGTFYSFRGHDLL